MSGVVAAQVGEEEERPPRGAVLTPPMSLEGGLAAEHRKRNIVQQLTSLLKTVRPGSDLTRFQLPVTFNMPKSQLQFMGEGIYCINEDMLSSCAKGKSTLERFTSVVAWSISTTRPLVTGFYPFSPILGETHHASKGTLNVLLEQVSHHPPVSALHATDAEENVELVWLANPVPRYNGTRAEVPFHGKRLLMLHDFGECYEMNAPAMVVKLLPVIGTEWAGNVGIRCMESGLEADLCYYKSGSFLGFGGNPRSVKGKILNSKTLVTIYEIYGQWDRTVMLKDADTGEVTILYNGKEAISKLNTPALRDPEGLLPTESAVVWAEVNRAILNRDWDRACDAKRSLEERERILRAERKARGETWVSKYFTMSHNKDGGWECWPNDQTVPPAPIVVPS